MLDFESDVTRVYTSNPDVADLVVITSREVVVNAKAQGIRDAAGLAAVRRAPVAFGDSVYPTLARPRRILSETFPKENLTVNGSRDAISLVGRVSTQEVSDRAVWLLKPFAQSVVSNLEVASLRGLRQVASARCFRGTGPQRDRARLA